MAKKDAYIEVNSGQKFYPFDLPRANISIEDVAHSLAHNCRFNGHTSSFYSVAEHSVLVSHLCEPENALAGLLHDASEAVISDIPKPIKNFLPDVQALEHQLELYMFDRYANGARMNEDIKLCDITALAMEATAIMPGADWVDELRRNFPLKNTGVLKVCCLSPMVAKQLFLARYKELTK